MSDCKVGQIITGQAHRDAIHVALLPAKAGSTIYPASNVALNGNKEAIMHPTGVGIADPFLKGPVYQGQEFYIWLHPNTVTGMRHHWEHTAIDAILSEPIAVSKEDMAAGLEVASRDEAEEWMRAWCKMHMHGFSNNDAAYRYTLEMGRTKHAGCNEGIGDYIDDEWWDNWDIITGERGDRERYFSCSC